MKYYLYALLVTALLASCKKNNNEAEKNITINDLAGTYTSANVAVAQAPEMYTKGGIVKDEGKIKAFVQSLKFPQLLLYNTSNMPLDSTVMRLTLNNNGAAKLDVLVRPPLVGNMTRLKFDGKVDGLTNDGFLVRNVKQDTSYFYFNETLKFNIKPVILPLPFETVIFDKGKALISQKKQMFVIKDGEVYLPMLLYCAKEVTPFNGTYGGTVRYQNNTFIDYTTVNPGLRDEMTATDTVVTQQLLIKLNKK